MIIDSPAPGFKAEIDSILAGFMYFDEQPKPEAIRKTIRNNPKYFFMLFPPLIEWFMLKGQDQQTLLVCVIKTAPFRITFSSNRISQ
jgi:hypothetical protein